MSYKELAWVWVSFLNNIENVSEFGNFFKLNGELYTITAVGEGGRVICLVMVKNVKVPFEHAEHFYGPTRTHEQFSCPPPPH